MSVPPQQPGYGNQPGGWPQQPGQPGQPPGAGYAQSPGGFPQSGDESAQRAGLPHAGQQPPQYGQFGQPSGFPQQPGHYGGFAGQPAAPAGWAQQPGQLGQFGQPGPVPPYGTPGQPPGQFAPYPNQFGEAPKKRRALPWVLAGGGVVVVAAVVLLVVWLAGGSGSTPQATAQAVIDKLNAKDVSGLKALSCKAEQSSMASSSDIDPMKDAPAEYRSMQAQWTLRGVQQKDDSHADAAINLRFTNIPANLPATVRDRMSQGVDGTLVLVKEDGDWKACDLKKAGSPS
ncbi:Rv0361 family membrane protein [Gandjariella thermophila]|uniref:DUF4878 domain-containing protein n=1 Tax=Gandjariella thermophila TaxID=1931992 RepID=A0A4D4IWM3_9PSEU|nr:hypothetical protein [Gandjariella thermophila]GDY28591.1 hypothetical protein GTS_02240 [Gandjariella thermophila]